MEEDEEDVEVRRRWACSCLAWEGVVMAGRRCWSPLVVAGRRMGF